MYIEKDFVRAKCDALKSGSKDYFYTYVHLTADTLRPFYVGKGSGKRAWMKHGRNKYWQNTVTKYGFVVDIIFSGLTEQESLQCEIDAILEYKYFGYKLCNLSTGGDNPVFNAETKARMSQSHRGKKLPAEQIAKLIALHTGRKRSPETCQRISTALTGKAVKDIAAHRRGSLKRSGANHFRVDKNTYRFINQNGDVFAGCRYEHNAKYPVCKKLLGKLFEKKPHNYSAGWALVLDGESDEEAMSKFKIKGTT
jgi:hypothetical protein